MSNDTTRTTLDIPRHIHGLHRSDLARVEDTVKVARLEVAQAMVPLLNANAQFSERVTSTVREMEQSLERTAQMVTHLTTTTHLLTGRIRDLESRTLRARWRRLIDRVARVVFP